MSRILKIKDCVDLKELKRFGWSFKNDRKNKCRYYYKRWEELIENDGSYVNKFFEYIILVDEWCNIKPREIKTYKIIMYVTPALEDKNLQDIKDFIEEVEEE